jgi:hypothetical protein
MWTEAELNEYLDEIRKEVCSRCVERPPGGPPCGPQGKPCGIEMHLPQLIDAVHEVKSDLIAPYLDSNRAHVCPKCPFLHSSFCPCPMETLVVLLVEAIEAVDARRGARGPSGSPPLPFAEPIPNADDLSTIFREAADDWIGCDWHTAFGPLRLDLKGMSSVAAETRAVGMIDPNQRQEWCRASAWLAGQERTAHEAWSHAALTVAAASKGDWPEAFAQARKAWALEVSTGRPLRHYPPTWQRLYDAARAATEAIAAVAGC